ILPLIGPAQDIPAPYVYTDAQTMAWIMDTYAMTIGHAAHGVVTGKPVSIGGSEGRGEATARGLLYVVEEACKVKKIPLRGATVAIQGFGNAGATAARLFAEKKAKIIALSDTRGGVTNSRGIDPLKAIRYKERSGTVVGMPGASRISNDELLTMKCDILIPAALENMITLHNAEAVRARLPRNGGHHAQAPRPAARGRDDSCRGPRRRSHSRPRFVSLILLLTPSSVSHFPIIILAGPKTEGSGCHFCREIFLALKK